MPFHLCRLLHSSALTPLHFYTLVLSALTPLNATLTTHLTSVDSKEVTVNLNPSESTLTKNGGGWGVLWLTTHPMRMRVLSERASRRISPISDKEICPEEHRDEGPLLNP